MRRRFLAVDGHEIAVLSANEELAGPAAIFLHGMLVSINYWPHVLPAEIKTSRRWHSLSLPGHAPSSFPEDEESITARRFVELVSTAIFRELGEEQVDLVGWSTGGFAALAIAADYPHAVTSVVSIAGFAHGCWSGPIGWLQRLLHLAPGGRAMGKAAASLAAGDRRMAQWCGLQLAARSHRRDAAPLIAAMLDATFTDISRHDAGVIVDLIHTISQADITDRLGDIRAPTLVMGGASDPIIAAAQTRLLAECVPGAELQLFEDTGHMIFAEQPKAHRRLLLRWLASEPKQVT